MESMDIKFSKKYFVENTAVTNQGGTGNVKIALARVGKIFNRGWTDPLPPPKKRRKY